ncbi:MAG TPA: class I SAM-dependent methyltransferase, partial [Thermomicrobiales bacterium]|nr:class I SAM-dependent methyltransferase [Thermomicrobiales bacterium]
FLRELEDLERAYLRNSDPIEQSGFYGGPERWRAEREPILDAVPSDGEVLDTGCANGYLLECLVLWGRERGLTLTPYGLDQGRGLIELARRRQPHLADHFVVGNAWGWIPPRRFRYVYTLLDQVPPDYLVPYLHRLLEEVVAPGGRLIAGDYGSRSRGIRARDVAGVLHSAGLGVQGEAIGGEHGVARFAWVKRNP